MGRKWNNIKDAKAAKDANKSKIYAKFGKEIYMAAKPEPNIETNVALRAILERAKTYKVPRDIIDRAIEKAKSGKDESYVAHRYEGYGPSGSAIIVDTLTDNVNRTVAEVRAAFNKVKGSLGVNGSVSFMFKEQAIVGFKGKSADETLELLLENDIEVIDVEEEDYTLVYAEANEFSSVQRILKENNIEEFEDCEITMISNDTIVLDEDEKTVFNKLIDLLEACEDVTNIYHNVE